MVNLREKYGHLSDDAWHGVLTDAARGTLQNPDLPGFPHDEIQAQFVGSSRVDALNEAYAFYRHFKGICASNGAAFEGTQSLLDFGCGWGRFIRFFAKDFSPERIFGADVDPGILQICEDTGVPGNFQRVDSIGALQLPDACIDKAIAYSVFTHLPEHVHLHWMRELARVTRPGGIFALTLEPRRFLDFVADVAPKGDSGWHRGMAAFAKQVPELKARFDRGEFVYLPTGGGDYRPHDVYGEAVVPLKYIETHWRDSFDVIDYLDDPGRFWQAVLVVRRK